MTEFETRFLPELPSLSSEEDVGYEGGVEAVFNGGVEAVYEGGEEAGYESRVEAQRAGEEGVKLREKTIKGREPLTRQDTFVLASPNQPSRSSPRSKSAYGIASILEKASQSAGLTDDAKRYIGTHMRLLTDENIKLAAENERLMKVSDEIKQSNNQDKEIKSLRAQLEKERGKNKMLLQRLKEGTRVEHTVWGAGDFPEPSGRDEEQANRKDETDSEYRPSPDLLTRSSSPLTLLNLSQEKWGGGMRMTRSFSTSRIGTPSSTRLGTPGTRTGTPGTRLGTPGSTRTSTPSSRTGTASTGTTSARTRTSSTGSRKSTADLSLVGTPSTRLVDTAPRQESEQVQLLQRKVRVYRGQVSNLRQELERLKHLLYREVGDDHVELILAGEDRGWVGRAERIQALEQSVDQLQSLLQDSGQSRGATEKPSEERELHGAQLSETLGLRPINGLKVLEGRELDYLNRRYSDLEVLNKASDGEKRRLEELVRLLTSRLSLLEQRTRDAEQSQREERARAAHLERLLERTQMELRDEGKSVDRLAGRYTRLSDEDDLCSVDEDQLRLEVRRLREESRALRRELGEARGAREEMLRIYSRMLEETRNTFEQRSS